MLGGGGGGVGTKIPSIIYSIHFGSSDFCAFKVLNFADFVVFRNLITFWGMESVLLAICGSKLDYFWSCF